MQLNQQILDYDKSYWCDGDYLDELATLSSVTDLLTATVELLQSDDDEALQSTLGFVQDLILWQSGDKRQAVREAYPDSIVVHALENLLLSDRYGIRRQASYVLGKTCSYSSIAAMTKAFYHWRDRDPIMLARLMGEMSWLGAENWDVLVDSMISSPRFPTRWAVVSLLEELLDEPDTEWFEQKRHRWETLRCDENFFVRQEAEYEYQLQQFQLEHSRLSDTERKQNKAFWRQKRKSIDRQYQPSITFATVTMRFQNHLNELDSSNYTIEQLEAFVKTL